MLLVYVVMQMKYTSYSIYSKKEVWKILKDQEDKTICRSKLI